MFSLVFIPLKASSLLLSCICVIVLNFRRAYLTSHIFDLVGSTMEVPFVLYSRGQIILMFQFRGHDRSILSIYKHDSEHNFCCFAGCERYHFVLTPVCDVIILSLRLVNLNGLYPYVVL